MAMCWTPGKVSCAGKLVSFADMHVSPKPLQNRIRRSGSAVPARRAAPRGAVRGRVAADTAAPSGGGRALRGIASGVRGTGARADPDADELSGRVQHHHREGATGRQGAVNRARYARRGCCRPVALPRSGRCRGLPINFHGNRNIEQLIELDGMLHARGQGASDISGRSASGHRERDCRATVRSARRERDGYGRAACRDRDGAVHIARRGRGSGTTVQR